MSSIVPPMLHLYFPFVRGVLTAAAVMAAAQAAANTVERRFQAESVSVDPAARTAVLHLKIP